MTDLIHEQPHPDAPQPEKPPENPKDRQKKVYTYIAVLFTIAFILILWSALSSQNSNQMVISEIKQNAAALQTTADALQSSLAENAELGKRVDELESQLEAAQEALESAQSSLDQLTADYEAAQETIAAQEKELEQLRGEGDNETTDETHPDGADTGAQSQN